MNPGDALDAGKSTGVDSDVLLGFVGGRVKRCAVTPAAAPLSAVRSCPAVPCSTLSSCVSHLGCSSAMVTPGYGAKALVLRDIHLLLWLYPLKCPVQMAAPRYDNIYNMF